jgi:hypothetical protein
VDDHGYYRPLPPNIYALTVSEVEPRVSQNGNDYYLVTFLWKGTDRKLFDTFADVPQARWKFQQLGCEEITDLSGLIGTTYRALVANEPWMGYDREQIRGYLAKEVN